MESTRMNIIPLEDNVWLLDDNGEAACYVVCGTERAMVIDTVNGYENLYDIVRTITDLPLTVVNTHGHPDHILGNVFFDEAWIHPDDVPIAERVFFNHREKLENLGAKPCPFRHLSVGQVFDLGGGTLLEVLPLEGHTPGSIALLDRKRRILFTGDGMNPYIWMQLEESRSISVLKSSLEYIRDEFGDEFDRVLYGHAREGYLDKGIIDRLINGCRQMLRGETENDQPYVWFCGTCLQHRYDDDPGAIIVYTDDKLK